MDTTKEQVLELVKETIETFGVTLDESGEAVEEGPGKLDGLPLTVLYFYNLIMGGMSVDTYEDEIGYTHTEFEIGQVENETIPGCLSLTDGTDNIIDIWENDQGFIQYSFKSEAFKYPETKRIRVTVDVYATVPYHTDIEDASELFDSLFVISQVNPEENLDISYVPETVEQME